MLLFGFFFFERAHASNLPNLRTHHLGLAWFGSAIFDDFLFGSAVWPLVGLHGSGPNEQRHPGQLKHLFSLQAIDYCADIGGTKNTCKGTSWLVYKLTGMSGVWVDLDVSWLGYELTLVRVDLGTRCLGYQLTWVPVVPSMLSTRWPRFTRHMPDVIHEGGNMCNLLSRVASGCSIFPNACTCTLSLLKLTFLTCNSFLGTDYLSLTRIDNHPQYSRVF